MRNSILKFFCIIHSSLVFSSVSIEQSSSSLKVQWQNLQAYRWQILTEQGVECWQEPVGSYQNAINIPKIAFDQKRILKLHTNDGVKTFELTQQEYLSTLPKVTQNAVIYQLPVRTWSAEGLGEQLSGHLNKLDHETLQKIKNLGVDYLWVTGVIESASYHQTDPDVVKGDAGSYYAIHDSWDVNEQIGGLNVFEHFIERAHQNGLRVMIDLVPNHTARSHRTDIKCKNLMDFGIQDNSNQFFDINNNYYYLQHSTFYPPNQWGKVGADNQFDRDIFRDGIQYEIPAKVTGNDIMSPTPSIHEWFETIKLNYGFDLQTRQAHYYPIPNTWDKVLDVARYWVSKGVDGFRMDFAHTVPIEFWQYFATNLKNYAPHVFLMAEAYEKDEGMKLPGYSDAAMLRAGFDSVYNSEVFWGLRHSNIDPYVLQNLDKPISSTGATKLNYIENHDEIRVASRFFAPHINNKYDRGLIGLNFSTWLALMPNHFLIHGGQELLEEAEVFGSFTGDNGKTSIFDYVYQTEVKKWRDGWYDPRVDEIRTHYKNLFTLKKNAPFNLLHTDDQPTFINLSKNSNSKILSYIRYDAQQKFLVVLNSDMHNSHHATVHFTQQDGQDSMGALAALGITNGDQWYEFTEVLYREGWIPSDPAFPRSGVLGSALYKAGGVPSGLYLGVMQPGQAYVLKLKN